MKATIVTTFMPFPPVPVTIPSSPADFLNSLLSRAFMRGNQARRCSIIFINFYNFVNPWASLLHSIDGTASAHTVGGSGIMIFQEGHAFLQVSWLTLAMIGSG